MLVSTTHVQADMHDGVLIAKLTCEKIDTYESSVIEGELLPLLTNIGKLAIDMAEVHTIAPIALGSFTKMHTRCASHGGGLALFHVRKDLHKLLNITPLGSLVSVAKNQAAAVKALA